MQATRAGSHLLQLTRLRISNCYLVRDSDGLTLIDTSLPGSAASILTAADRLGQPIRRIGITHVHHDHAGALEELRERLPDVEFAVGSREVRLLQGDFAPHEGEPRGRLRRYLYEESTITPDRLLGSGDRLGPLQVIEAPGHTPGHLAFFDPRDRTLIAGDSFLAVGRLFVTTEFEWRFPFPALSGTWHAATALDTAGRLCELKPSQIATGHGPVIEGASTEMERALKRASERKAWGG
jgi:glyoxylase-like metal-dependent hydrolase (beta-lactamase superfamily II)